MNKNFLLVVDIDWSTVLICFYSVSTNSPRSQLTTLTKPSAATALILYLYHKSTYQMTALMSFADQRRQLSYRLFGPTTLHLQHEFYLWISLSLLTLSSLMSLYRHVLQWGDGVLMTCVSLWLSRHFLMRWLCTHDAATARNPTILGVVMHWITSYVTAGQYMDRPDPHLVAKHAGTPQEDLALLPSASYTLHFLRVRFWYPLMRCKKLLVPGREERIRAVSSSQRRPSISNTPTSWRTSAYFKWIQWGRDHGISIQFSLAVIVATAMVWEMVVSVYHPRVTGTINDYDNIQPRGVYRTLDSPAWTRLFLYISRTAVLLTIFLYGRIALPIPDLVSGANVLKSVRAETLFHGSNANVGGVSVPVFERGIPRITCSHILHFF